MMDLAAINDWLALCEAKARYCRFCDTKDWAAWGELFTDDIEYDVSGGSSVDFPVLRGREAVVSQVSAALEGVQISHQPSSPEMRIEGDEARVIWAMHECVVHGAGKPVTFAYGHYHERWVRQEGHWKLAALRLNRYIVHDQPPPTA